LLLALAVGFLVKVLHVLLVWQQNPAASPPGVSPLKRFQRQVNEMAGSFSVIPSPSCLRICNTDRTCYR